MGYLKQNKYGNYNYMFHWAFYIEYSFTTTTERLSMYRLDFLLDNVGGIYWRLD